MAAKSQPRRGDLVLYPLKIIDGPDEDGRYGLEFWDEWLSKMLRLTTTLPQDTQVISHDPDMDGESGGE